MDVHWLDAPQLGDTVLYFQEFRASQPGLAHRQRVVSLVVDHQLHCVRAEQLLFRDGPTYDRAPLEASVVAAMPEGAFRRYPNCDLFFSEELTLNRFRGRMQPRSCVYPHPIDGEVYAEFEMLLYPDQLWYRDRSLRLADGTVRGEVDGFSWLLFDRTSSPTLVPVLLEQQGVWQGIFPTLRCHGKPPGSLPQ